MLSISGTKLGAFLCLLDATQAIGHSPGSPILNLLQVRRAANTP